MIALIAVLAAAEQPLAACINRLAEKHDLSGVVSVAGARGEATVARGAPADSRFNLASAGKMFTAVAVAQLVEQGKVGLDDPIGRHVDGLSAATAAVTVRQLLAHTGGLGNFFTPGNLPAIEKARSVSDLLPLAAADQPAFPPGSRFQYSNSGYLLLGRLIERASGQGYGEYLASRIFRPAKMAATGLDGEGAPHGTPAGGAFSTAADMQRFFAALPGGKLVSAGMLAKLTAAGAEQPGYGLGFGTGAFEGHRWFGHNGGAPGANAETATFPGDGVTVVVLSNHSPPAATNVFRDLRQALFDASALAACAGP
jgi:CubicO group peptidase (beta-lactamase class C family)